MRDEYDFSGSRRGPIVKGNKERIRIRLDPEIIEWFRTQEQDGGNYQTLINDALLGHIQRQGSADLETTVRPVLRDELRQS